MNCAYEILTCQEGWRVEYGRLLRNLLIVFFKRIIKIIYKIWRIKILQCQL